MTMATMKKIKKIALWCLGIALIFTILKLTRVVKWSWLWVLSPIWMPFITGLIFIIIIILAVILQRRKRLGIDD